MREHVMNDLNCAGLIPAVAFDNSGDAVFAVGAMRNGGLNVVEITMRTSAALDSITAVANAYPDMLVGAGTVLSVESAQLAVKAGAKYIVSPGLDEGVVRWCMENDIAVVPGCVTPTEITRALSLGLNVVKFFPAEIYGGLKAIKALHAPFQTVSFIPTGGVDLASLGKYVDKSYIYAVGGSWLCPKDMVKNRNGRGISDIVRESIRILLGFDPGADHCGTNAYNTARAAYYLNKYGTGRPAGDSLHTAVMPEA